MEHVEMRKDEDSPNVMVKEEVIDDGYDHPGHVCSAEHSDLSHDINSHLFGRNYREVDHCIQKVKEEEVHEADEKCYITSVLIQERNKDESVKRENPDIPVTPDGLTNSSSVSNGVKKDIDGGKGVKIDIESEEGIDKQYSVPVRHETDNSEIVSEGKYDEKSCGKKEFVCKMCQKKFVKKSSLRSHEITHTGETPFKCDVCNKGFNVRSNLNVHLRIHTGQRPHECEICKKTFRQAGQLKTHEMIHNNEKPYVCDECNRSFRNSSALITHQRTHTGERPFPCDLCSRSFSTSTSLKTHRVTHSGTMLFDCPMCGRQFNRRNNLNVHIKRHNKDHRKFLCTMCSNGFVMRAHLLRHLKRAHKVEVTAKDLKSLELYSKSEETEIKQEKIKKDLLEVEDSQSADENKDVEFVKCRYNVNNEQIEIKKDLDDI